LFFHISTRRPDLSTSLSTEKTEISKKEKRNFVDLINKSKRYTLFHDHFYILLLFNLIKKGTHEHYLSSGTLYKSNE